MAFHSLLQRRFAPRKAVRLPSLRSRMTGKYLLPFCKKPFYVLTHTCPFRQPGGWHFPRQAGTAYISCTFLLRRKVIYRLSKTQFSSAVILERWADSEWWQKKKHHVPLSEESGIGYRKAHLISPNSAWILHFVQEWQTGIYCRSVKNVFFVSAHACPFRQLADWHFPRVRGQLAFRILFFCGNFHSILLAKRNSLMPSFLSGGQKRNDYGRKNIIWLLAKNPA